MSVHAGQLELCEAGTGHEFTPYVQGTPGQQAGGDVRAASECPNHSVAIMAARLGQKRAQAADLEAKLRRVRAEQADLEAQQVKAR